MVGFLWFSTSRLVWQIHNWWRPLCREATAFQGTFICRQIHMPVLVLLNCQYVDLMPIFTVWYVRVDSYVDDHVHWKKVMSQFNWGVWRTPGRRVRSSQELMVRWSPCVGDTPWPSWGPRWRNRLLAAVGVAAAWLWPKMAYARVAKRCTWQLLFNWNWLRMVGWWL